MMLGMFYASPNASVLGLYWSIQDWTHSSAGAEYERQSDLPALWSQMLRQSVSEERPPELLLYLNSALCLRPTPARTGFGRRLPRGSPGRPEATTDSEKAGETPSVSVWNVYDKSTF